MKLICGLFAVILMTGCAEMGQVLREANAYQTPSRDYIANPITSPVYPTTQPNFQPFGSQTNEYQLIMINTPSGLVQKRCKVLNGQVVHCL